MNIPNINLSELKKLKKEIFKERKKQSMAWIKNGKCINVGKYICNLGYACDACPYNKEK